MPGRLAVRKAISVWIIIVANAGAFLLELSAPEAYVRAFALWPLGAGFQPWQPLTYAFVHASVAHLAVNLFGIWMFGSDVELAAGRRHLLYLYFASVLSAALTQLLVAAVTGSVHPTVGASGGVFGLLLAYAMYFPRRILVLVLPPMALPAWLFALIYAVLELVLGITGTLAGIAHFAHLGGMIGGYLVVRRFHGKLPR